MARSHRRNFLKGVGATGTGLAFTGTSSAFVATGDPLGGIVDGVVQEALIVFDDDTVLDVLTDRGIEFYEFQALPIVYLEATGLVLEQLSLLDGVVSVRENRELEWFNEDVRRATGVDTVQTDLGYAGDGVHVAVVDSGSNPTHPDLALENNYEWVGNPLGSPTLFVDVPVDTDEIGHGTHVSGTVGGDGSASGGKYRGMAPDATLTAYSTSLGVTILKAVAAYDHLLANHADSVDVISNSYGASSSDDFDGSLPLNVATEKAYDAGLLSTFAAGNSGPSFATLNDYAKAPWVLGVGATNDDGEMASFSSRGRPDGNHDRSQALSNGTGLYRPGVCAPGVSVVSTMGPADPLQAADNGGTWSLFSPYYAAISGTSMSTPAVSGIAALVIEAYKQHHDGDAPDPLTVIDILEDTADGSYPPAVGGRGFVDADGAVEAVSSDGSTDSTTGDTTAGDRSNSTTGGDTGDGTGSNTDNGLVGLGLF